MNEKSFTLAELAALANAQVQGDPGCKITGVAPLDRAQAGQISFLSNPQFRQYLTLTKASAVILNSKDAGQYSHNALVSDDPYLSYAKIASLFIPELKRKPGIHPTVLIGQNCKISPSVTIGPYCVIEDNVTIGEKTIVAAGCFIGEGTTIGNNCHFWPNVTLYHDVQIGNHVTLHAGVVIGSDGFGLANDNGKWQKIPQFGTVIIGDNVEVGANTTIDRGALDNTVIEEGVKLDNQIQVAHNVHIGAHTAIAGCTGIAGSAKIGKHCMIGGGVSVSDHVEITDKVVLLGTAAVEKSLTEPGIYGSGTGILPYRELGRTVSYTRKLADLFQRLKQLENNRKDAKDAEK